MTGREGEAEAERETTRSGEESVGVEWGQATFLSAVKHGGVRGNFRAVALWCHVQVVWVRF